MNISIHVNVKNPERNQFPYLEAIRSYIDLADEVIVVDGGSDDGSIEKIKALSSKVKVVNYNWPDRWIWNQLGLSTNVGYQTCTGDWAIKCDIDYIFHEDDMEAIRTRLISLLDTRAWVASFEKVSIQLADRFYTKSQSPLAVNKRDYGDVLAYGRAYRKDNDFMWAIRTEATPNGRAVGPSILEYPLMTQKIRENIYSYSMTFMTLEHLEKERPKYDYARASYYNEDFSEEKLELFSQDAVERIKVIEQSRWKGKNWQKIKSHPKYIQERIKNLTPDQFGYKAFGWLGENVKVGVWK